MIDCPVFAEPWVGPPAPCKLGVIMYICNPSTGKAETRESWVLTGQPVQPMSRLKA